MMQSSQSSQPQALSLCYQESPLVTTPDFFTIYAFGSQTGTGFGELIFQPDGEIYGYENDNACAWTSVDNELCLLDLEGAVTSRFRYIAEGIWQGHVENKSFPLYLLPLLKTDRHSDSGEYRCSGFLVNSIPKSGTYFLEAALREAGIPPVRLHLSGTNIVDDYRQLSDDEVHVNPERCRVNFPVHLVTHLLQGRAAVGHIESSPMLDLIRQQQVCIFNLRRNLRDVLVSLYRFKYKKVKPCGEVDGYWREMSEQSRFIAFLITYSTCDIAHIKEIALMMLSDEESIPVKYEEMCSDSFSEEVKAKLDGLKPGFSQQLSAGLMAQYGKKNPTFSGTRSNWQDYWSEDAEKYFVISGLKEINIQLGYE